MLKNCAMRDEIIEFVYNELKINKNIMFLCADFGAPMLDALRAEFPDHFINVGIAEQNLINMAAGFAIEGFTVYSYAISAFLSMRSFEQVRTNISLTAQLKKINVNMLSVGAGVSYVLSGPSHHCIEDLCVMRMLPNIQVFSPSDSVLVKKYAGLTLSECRPKYMRFDSKTLPLIYNGISSVEIKRGFYELIEGSQCCLVSTGYMTHTALKAAEELKKNGISAGVIDVFLLSYFDENILYETLKKYDFIITLEEGFVNKGGLDSLITNILVDNSSTAKIKRIGFKDSYIFDNGSREYLHSLHNMDYESICAIVKKGIKCR